MTKRKKPKLQATVETTIVQCPAELPQDMPREVRAALVKISEIAGLTLVQSLRLVSAWGALKDIIEGIPRDDKTSEH